MDLNYCIKQFLVNYNSFIDQVMILFDDKDVRDYLFLLNSESKDKKWARGVQFYKSINDELFDLLIESKIKLFSHKDDNTRDVSESLYGSELSLKKIFNNRDDKTKLKLWSYLHLMFLMIELAQKKQNKDRITKLTNVVEEEENKMKNESALVIANQQNSNTNDPKNMIKNMLGVEVNQDTNEMLEDIIKSFEKTLNSNSSNPLAGIFEISQKISGKYQDKISKGDIELDKLLSGIQKHVPGIDQMMKGGMFNKEDEKPAETVIIDENFSTAKVEKGEVHESQPTNVMKFLKIADSFGVLPGSKPTEGGGLPDFKSMISSLMGDAALKDPKMESLLGMMSEMTDMKTPEEAEKFKEKMDTYLQNELGIDINKINETSNE